MQLDVRGVCPGEDLLAGHSTGALSAETYTMVDRHLESCQACRHLAGSLAREQMPPVNDVTLYMRLSSR